MKRIICLGSLVALFALFANVDTAEARHRCPRTGLIIGGYYGAPYAVGPWDYGYGYGYGPRFHRGYVGPRHGFHRRGPYRGSRVFVNPRRGRAVIRF
jgi:hypothetical protein